MNARGQLAMMKLAVTAVALTIIVWLLLNATSGMFAAWQQSLYVAEGLLCK